MARADDRGDGRGGAVLAADDTGAFMSKVAHLLWPNKKNEPPQQPSPSR